MRAECLPARDRAAFVHRLEDADAEDAADAAEAADAAAADAADAADTSESESGWASDGSDSSERGAGSGAAAYELFAACERQLRLLVEVRCGAHDVHVYESPLHSTLGDTLSDAACASLSLRAFRVQRSFARHVCGRVASCAGRGLLPISLQFSLSHPLFQCGIESAAVLSPRAGQCDFALHQTPRRFAAPAAPAAPAEPTVGVVRVRLGAGTVRLALEPHHLVALWSAGRRAQRSTEPGAERAQHGRAY